MIILRIRLKNGDGEMDIKWKIKYAVFSECGNRRRNEDAIGIRLNPERNTGLFIVCDGMGGLQRGDEASQIVVDTFLACWDTDHHEYNTLQLLNRATLQAKESVDKMQCRETGSTMVLAVVKNDILTIAHLGDSRGYLYRPKSGFLYRTKDHVTIGEEGWQYVSKGFFSFRDIQMPEVNEFKIEKGDRILLCSDGVSGFVKEDELVRTCLAVADIEEASAMLKNLCASRSYDNYSAILVEMY